MMPSPLGRARATRQDSVSRTRETHRGLQFDVTIDPANAKRCVATLTLADEFLNVPGMTHGGLLFTAMERLATQVPTLLRKDTSHVWLVRTASITNYRPGCPEEPVVLSGFIEWDGVAGEPIVIHTEACDGDDGLLAEGDYTIVPVPMKRFERGSSIPLVTGSFEVPRAISSDGRGD